MENLLAGRLVARAGRKAGGVDAEAVKIDRGACVDVMAPVVTPIQNSLGDAPRMIGRQRLQRVFGSDAEASGDSALCERSLELSQQARSPAAAKPCAIASSGRSAHSGSAQTKAAGLRTG